MQCALAFAVACQSNALSRLAHIGYERGRFEATLVRQKKFGGLDRIGSALMATPFSTAMYPAGESGRRVVWIVWEDREEVLYQETRKGRPMTVWYLTLAKGQTGTKPLHGSLRRLFYGAGMHIKSQHLVPGANALLDAELDFACYSFMAPTNQIVASFLPRGGKRAVLWMVSHSPHAKRPFLPISPEEANRLGLGGTGWVPKGYKLAPLRAVR